MSSFKKDIQYYKFGFYGFLKNLRFFEPFLILFFLAVGLSYLQIGILYSFREIARNILEIPAGVFADTFGRKRSMIISFVSYLISFCVFFFAPSYEMFFAAMLFYAIGDAFRTGTHKAMIFDYLIMNNWQQHKINYYGHTRSFSQFGTAISSLIAAAIVLYTGDYRTIFILSAIPYLFNLILLSSYPKELDGAIRNNDNESISSQFKIIFNEFKLAFKKIHLLKTISSISLFSAYNKTIKDFIQPIIVSLAISIPIASVYSDEQKSAIAIGVIYFFVYLLTSIAAKNSARISNLFNAKETALNTLLFIGLVSGFMAGILYYFEFSLLSILLMVPVFLIENMRKPIGVAMVADSTEKNILASVLSVQSQIQTLIIIIAAPILGYFSDILGLGIGIVITTSLFIIGGFVLRIGGK